MYQHYQSIQGKLIYKVLFLQQIWNDINIGESEANKDHTRLELERQCLEVYRPKVEEAANAKARLHCQGTPPLSVAAEVAELATLMAERLHQDFGLFVDLVKCGILLFCLDVLVYHVRILELLRTW